MGRKPSNNQEQLHLTPSHWQLSHMTPAGFETSSGGGEQTISDKSYHLNPNIMIKVIFFWLIQYKIVKGIILLLIPW